MNLSNNPITALRQAAKDILTVCSDHRVQFDMEHWVYSSDADGMCHVCLAGSVMLKRLKCNSDCAFPSDPGYYYPDTCTMDKLYAFNALRTGLKAFLESWPTYHRYYHKYNYEKLKQNPQIRRLLPKIRLLRNWPSKQYMRQYANRLIKLADLIEPPKKKAKV